MKHKPNAKSHPAPRANPVSLSQTGSPKMRWALLGLCLLLAGGATWAFMEFVVWNNLPGELVGAWEVVQGPPEYKQAEFQFYRSGKMVGHFNDSGRDRPIHAEVRVEGDKLYITTRRPTTGEEHVSVQTIRIMNGKELVVADERGIIIKMARTP
jgi:hypothetical protein